MAQLEGLSRIEALKVGRSPYDFVQPSRFLKCYRNRIQYRRLICESCRGPDNNITYKSYCQDLLDKIQFIQVSARLFSSYEARQFCSLARPPPKVSSQRAVAGSA